MYIFYSIYWLKISAVCVCERGVGVFHPSEPLSATLPTVRGLDLLEKCEQY